MDPAGRYPNFARDLFTHALGCWNWKCALLSAAARSIVYLAAMAHTGLRGGMAIVVVEMAYVILTAGLYAGLQQKALSFTPRLLGDLTVVIGAPRLAQVLDWLTHRAVGAAAPGKATLAVCVFAAISALFHLHVMRRGVFLTRHVGHSLIEDSRRIPRLTAGFVARPFVFLYSIATWPALPSSSRTFRSAESEAAL